MLSFYWLYWCTRENFGLRLFHNFPLYPTPSHKHVQLKLSCSNTSTWFQAQTGVVLSLFGISPFSALVYILYFFLLLFCYYCFLFETNNLFETETEKCDVPFHSLQILIEDLFYLFPKLYPQETSCLNSDYAEAKWSWYEKQRAVLRAQSPFSHNWLIVNIFLKNYCQPWTVQLFHFFSVLLAVPAIVGN